MWSQEHAVVAYFLEVRGTCKCAFRSRAKPERDIPEIILDELTQVTTFFVIAPLLQQNTRLSRTLFSNAGCMQVHMRSCVAHKSWGGIFIDSLTKCTLSSLSDFDILPAMSSSIGGHHIYDLLPSGDQIGTSWVIVDTSSENHNNTTCSLFVAVTVAPRPQSFHLSAI